MQQNDHQYSDFRCKERGGALWFILIAIALISALTAVVSRSSNTVDQSGDVEQQNIKISQMLRYAKGLQAGVQNLKLQGISESDMSFENSGTNVNSNCTNTYCRIFHVEGAGLSYQAPPSGVATAADWLITGTNNVQGVGSSAPDLVLMLRGLNSSLCTQLNRQLGVTIPDDADLDFTVFAGSYTATATIDGASRKEAGCVGYDSGSVEPIFFHVLLAR